MESWVECGDGHSTLVTILATWTTVPGFGTLCGHMNHCAWISLADLYLARWPSVELQDSYQYVIVTGPKWESSYYIDTRI